MSSIVWKKWISWVTWVEWNKAAQEAVHQYFPHVTDLNTVKTFQLFCYVDVITKSVTNLQISSIIISNNGRGTLENEFKLWTFGQLSSLKKISSPGLRIQIRIVPTTIQRDKHVPAVIWVWNQLNSHSIALSSSRWVSTRHLNINASDFCPYHDRFCDAHDVIPSGCVKRNPDARSVFRTFPNDSRHAKSVMMNWVVTSFTIINYWVFCESWEVFDTILTCSGRCVCTTTWRHGEFVTTYAHLEEDSRQK